MTLVTSLQRRIRPLFKEGLPQLSSAHAAATRRISACMARIPSSASLSVRELGGIEIRLSHLVDPAHPLPGAPSDEIFWIVGAGFDEPARLTVPAEFALRLTNAVVGLPEALLPRAPGPVERGILMSLVTLTLGRSGLGARLRVEAPETLSGVALTVALRVRTRAGVGLVSLALPATWLQEKAANPVNAVLRSAFTNLDLVLRMEAGRTLLDAPVWAAAGPGDVVVFDGVSALAPRGVWPLSLGLGGQAAKAALDFDGTLKLTSRFVSRPERIRMTKTPLPSTTAPPSDQAADVVASAPVEVVAEVGRIVLRADELLGLVEGTALSFGGRSLDGVLLRVGDRPWARGELVVIDDELGVRITAVLPEAKR